MLAQLCDVKVYAVWHSHDQSSFIQQEVQQGRLAAQRFSADNTCTATTVMCTPA